MSSLGPTDALVLVDVQNDFLPGGSLAVPHADEIIPVLNCYLGVAQSSGARIVATRDWHPRDHCSFQERGGPWPPHCVAGTVGAAFSPALLLPRSALIVSKGASRERDAYSAFDGTDLHERLRAASVRRLLVGGLATDRCVLHTVEDAVMRGYRVWLLEDGVRAIDVRPGDGLRAKQLMVTLGAERTRVDALMPAEQPAAGAP